MMTAHEFQVTAPTIAVYPDGRMTVESAAQYLGVSTKALALWRMQGDGPCFCKLGRRVFYTKTDLDAWIASRRVSTTAQARAVRAGGAV